MATETQYPGLKESPGTAQGSPSSSAAQSDSGEILLLNFIILLAVRKRMILVVTATFALFAIVISLVWPKSYTADAVLLPPQQNSSLSSLLSSQLGGLGSVAALAGGSLGIKNPNDMFVAMLRSQTVEDNMVHDFELQREYHQRLVSGARKSFEKHSTVDGNGKDGLIHISVEARTPDRAAQLANGYVEEFRRLSRSMAFTEAQQRALFFQQQLEQSKDNLANAEVALQQTEQKTGLIQLDSQARALIESAASLRAQIDAKEVQLEALKTYATGQNAQLVQTQQELDSLRAELAKLGGSEDSANALIVPKGKLTQSGLDYVRKLRDVKYYETIFDILARQFEVAKLDEAKEGAVIQVVDSAIPPDKKSSPKRVLIVVIATVVGFLLAVMIAVAQAAWARMKQDPEAGAKLALLRRVLRGKSAPVG